MNACKIYHCEQRSDEWNQLRRGTLTASNFGPWLLKNDATSRKARESAICKMIAERAGCEMPPNFENWAMKRGTELEPQAVEAFEQATGKKIRPVGFCRSIHGHFGCSPDGLIVDENAGFEGKVPVADAHIKYRRAGELPSEYMYQVHGCMAITGADRWYFQAWNPGLAPLRIVVHRDQFTEQLLDALKAFSSEFEQAWKEEAEAAAKEKGEG